MEAKGELETLARHETQLLSYAKAHSLPVTKIYKEVVSGESIEKRPQMIQLLEDVSKCMYDGVVVVELERLSRGNQIDQCEILEIFKKSKTKIFTLNKTYDLSSYSNLELPIQGSNYRLATINDISNTNGLGISIFNSIKFICKKV